MKKLHFVMVMVLGLGLTMLPLFSAMTPAASAKTLKIGNTVPMKAKEGIQIKKWLELLAERTNKAGGLKAGGETYNIEIISYDDEYSADAGRAAAEAGLQLLGRARRHCRKRRRSATRGRIERWSAYACLNRCSAN